MAISWVKNQFLCELGWFLHGQSHILLLLYLIALNGKYIAICMAQHTYVSYHNLMPNKEIPVINFVAS